ncbi:MAG: DUF2182 domain-containing protein [Hasllibacter sp.]
MGTERAAIGWGLRAAAWLAVFAAILAAWWWLAMMAGMSGLDWLGRPVAMNMMPMEGLGTLFAMWAVMMAAMMLPTMAPTMATYETLIRTADGTRAGWAGVLLGYFAVWIGMALLLALAQVAMVSAGLVDGLGRAATWLGAAILLAAGLWQFTRLKAVCHGVCHAPAAYFVGRWRTGFRGGLRMGAGLGAFCAGCCWGFMALGFTLGTMSLAWMGAATLLMVLEKIPPIGHHLLKPTGAALIAAAIAFPFWS